MEVVNEIMNLCKVWLTVCISLCYCYWISKHVPKGTLRLISILPIVLLFLLLPLSITSVHLTGTTGFFISWLSNFKLLLLAFGKGPLTSNQQPPISLKHFILLSCLPIKMIPKQRPKLSHHIHLQNKNPHKPYITPLQYSIKAIVVAIMVKIYDYSDLMHPNLIFCLYALHIYFLLELTLAIAIAILGMELEPQFDNPFLSTSLQNFWGKRWNLMVTNILRPTVYEPTLSMVTRVTGRRWAPPGAIIGTFVVSAVMHEVIMYYMGRVGPSFRMTWFFVVNGLGVAVEVAVKKVVDGRWALPAVVSRPLTVVFVVVTSFWLFLPEFVRCKVDVRAFEEYAVLGAFLRNATHAPPL